MNQADFLLIQKYFSRIIGPSILETLSMVSLTMLVGFTAGFGLAVCLTLYGEDGLNPKPRLYSLLNFMVNTVRSFPGLILIVAISPFTRLIVGTTVGQRASVVPLAIACTALVARLLEDSFKRVDRQLIEAARSFGASDMQIVFRVIVWESIPAMVSVATLATVTFIAMSTIAGAVGGGGLGAIALNYGYQSFNNFVLYTCVLILFLLVQFTQWVGNMLSRKLQ